LGRRYPTQQSPKIKKKNRIGTIIRPAIVFSDSPVSGLLSTIGATSKRQRSEDRNLSPPNVGIADGDKDIAVVDMITADDEEQAKAK